MGEQDNSPKMVSVGQADLAVTIAEGMFGLERPEGMSAEDALKQFSPELRESLLAAALNALDYFVRSMNNAGCEASVFADTDIQ